MRTVIDILRDKARREAGEHPSTVTSTTPKIVDINSGRLVAIALKAEAHQPINDGEMCFILRLARQRMDDLAATVAPKAKTLDASAEEHRNILTFGLTDSESSHPNVFNYAIETWGLGWAENEWPNILELGRNYLEDVALAQLTPEDEHEIGVREALAHLPLAVSEPHDKHAPDGSILITDVANNDIAVFFHRDQATVGQSYDVALAFAKQLVSAANSAVASPQAAVEGPAAAQDQGCLQCDGTGGWKCYGDEDRDCTACNGSGIDPSTFAPLASPKTPSAEVVDGNLRKRLNEAEKIIQAANVVFWFDLGHVVVNTLHDDFNQAVRDVALKTTAYLEASTLAQADPASPRLIGDGLTPRPWCELHHSKRTTPTCPVCGIGGDQDACRGRVPEDGLPTAKTWASGALEALRILSEVKLSGILPDCMMPDGAAPCRAFADQHEAISAAVELLRNPDCGVEVERIGKDRQGVSVILARSEYDSEAHRVEEPMNGLVVTLDVDGTILSLDISDLKADMTQPTVLDLPKVETPAEVGELTERDVEAPIYEAFARYVGDANERATEFRMFATGYHAALSAAPAARPGDGFVLVPRTPTEEMIEAAVLGSHGDVSFYDVEELWPAMLDAAPNADGGRA